MTKIISIRKMNTCKQVHVNASYSVCMEKRDDQHTCDVTIIQNQLDAFKKSEMIFSIIIVVTNFSAPIRTP